MAGIMNIKELIKLSLEEDLKTGDITTEYLKLGPKEALAFIVAKEVGILAGLDVVQQVFNFKDPNVHIVSYKKDGDKVAPGDEIIKVSGTAENILKSERVALNFLQRLSGIATLTNRMADLISPYGVKLLDTRKTTPLFRELEKYAVKVGGGYNHRFGLYDMVMLKDNHIEAVGSITEAVKRVKQHNLNYKIEVEVKDLQELMEALKCSVDRVLLDNMSIDELYKAVDTINQDREKSGFKVEAEISGGVNLENIEAYAQTGVDFISTGAITHSAKSLDISLLFREI